MLMKTSAFYCLYSRLSGSLTTNKFLARAEILKILLHVKLQQNLDTYSSFSLPSFSNTVSFQTHRILHPIQKNPRPVTSVQNSEILSQYLSNYSVEPQRPPSSTTVLPQYHTRPRPISINTPLLPGENGSSDVSSVLSIQIVLLQLYILQRVISEIQ